MYKLKTQHRIYGSHVLKDHPGKCSTLHGHQYEVILELHSETLNHINMVVDTHMVKEVFNAYVKTDHLDLNLFLCDENPTMELMAKKFYDDLKKELSCLYSVTVFETPEDSVTYVG